MVENKILSNGNYPLSEEERNYRIDLASKFYGEFLSAMGFDWENDPNMKDTPLRVSKAFINELCSGCFSF
jgi:GTP cyclohydrolase I